MKDEVCLLFLKIVKYNGNLSPLTNLGYDYPQISELITNSMRENLAENKNGRLILTPLGENEILRLSKVLNKKKNSWIEPKIDARIEKINENTIYLPNRMKLSSLDE
jgi:hypothetical protein